MTTITIQVPDSLDLTAQRVQIGDSVEFIDKINTTQQNLELFSQQLTTFSSDLQQAVVVIDGIAASSAQTAADGVRTDVQNLKDQAAASAQTAADDVRTDLQNLVDQAETLKSAASTSSTEASQHALNAKNDADRAQGLAASFTFPTGTAVPNAVMVQKPDASGFEYKTYDWENLPGHPEFIQINSDTSVSAGFHRYHITADCTVTLPANADSNVGDQIRLTKSTAAKPIIQAANGESLNLNNESDQSMLFDLSAELIFVFDNEWRV